MNIAFLEPTHQKRKIIHQSEKKGLHRQICGNTNAALQPCEFSSKDAALPNRGIVCFDYNCQTHSLFAAAGQKGGLRARTNRTHISNEENISFYIFSTRAFDAFLWESAIV